MITREHKSESIKALSERFSRAKAAFLVDFKGLNVEQMTELRKKLSPLASELKVVRNTLAKRALMEHPEAETAISKAFTGNNAVVFSFDDPSASAKALTEFGKSVEEFVIKTGVMNGKALSANEVSYLATLPTKPELQAKLLGTLKAPMGKFVTLLSQVPTGFVRVLQARKEALDGGSASA